MGSVLWIGVRRLWWLAPVILAAAGLVEERMVIAHLRAQLLACQAAAVKQQASIAQLRAGIAAQNLGVENLLDAAHRAQERAAAAGTARQLAAARALSTAARRVARIEAAPVPSPCASAAAWGVEQAAGLAQGWGR
jgi:hypothetical protein